MAELAEVPQITSSSFFRDPYEAARGAHAIVLMTPWPEFKQLDFAALGSAATSGALFFDATNFLRDKQVEIEKAGFRYQRVGKAPK
jgi:UDPglucose 6-dehydrogenase